MAIVLTAEVTAPLGINGYTCYGFFRKCAVKVCIEVSQEVAAGTAAVPALSDYTYCTLSSEYKLHSPSCVFDSNLYHQSATAMGYDICVSDFNQGVYIMEDTFEDWALLTDPMSSQMVSAHWLNVTNGQTDGFCGAADGTRSLRFGGVDARFGKETLVWDAREEP